MGDLSKNFSRHEFACKCGCGFDTVDAELLKVDQDVADHFRSPVTVNSGCRCINHNDAVILKYDPTYVPGTSTSTHLEAKGNDITVAGIHADDVADYLEKKYPNKYGIGRYVGRTHIDVRETKARWDTR